MTDRGFPPFEPAPFRPPAGLSGRHVQTIVGHLARPTLDLPVRRTRLELPDGDFVDVDVLECGEGRSAGTPAVRASVVILHGLEGSSDRAYVRVLMWHLWTQGLDSVALNFRGCSGVPNRLPRAYHSGDTGDVHFLLEHVRASRAGPVGAVGFSLGGNVLLKYLGERGADAPLDAAVAISVPYDLQVAARTLTQGMWGSVYTGYFLRKLKRKMRAKRSLLPTDLVGSGLAARSLEAFDDAVTAPLHGFADARDYYARSSAAGYVGRIRTPTLLLQALDDPFLPRAAIPLDRIRENPALSLVATARGGHLGFLRQRGPAAGGWEARSGPSCNEAGVPSETPMLGRFWAEAEAARFLGWRMISLWAG